MISIGPKGTAAEMNVSKMSYGAMGLTGAYGDMTPEKEAIAILRRAYDLGVRHFDTAQIYVKEVNGVMFYNEELVGRFLRTLTPKQKKDVTVATKFVPTYFMNPSQEWNEEHFVAATEASRKRLGVDLIDLYYFHRIIPEQIEPVETWMTAAIKLIGTKIKRIGLSEAPASVIRKANAIYPITCVQQEWSIFARDLEEDIIPTCKELGIGIICYSPIGRGFLAGSFLKTDDAPTDWRATVPYLTKENIGSNLELLDEIKAMAERKNCTTGQLCLAWLMAQGGIPIPGTTKVHHLEDNMGALNVELTVQEIEELGEIGNKVVGERGDEHYMKATFQIHKDL